MYPRKLAGLMRELLGQFRIVYLTGPRQAGKTTLAKALAQELGMSYLTLDQQALLESALHDPHGLIQSYENTSIVLDEFQYAPGLVPAIKAVSDSLASDAKGKFLLTGSADIFRSAKVQESLPGHMARLELYPLSLSEKTGSAINVIDYLVAGHFRPEQIPALKREDIAQQILLGGYPEVQDKSAKARNIWFQSYIDGRLFISLSATSTGIGSPIGVPGALASAGAVAHGAYNFMDGMQGMANAINATNYDGPFAQFGELFFGKDGHAVGNTIDKALSIRGYLKSGVNVFGRQDATLGDVQSVADASKKYFDTHEVNYCPASGSYFH